MTKTRLVANFVTTRNKRGLLTFNDRLQDGRRSLKVWGWGNSEYILAVEMLRQLGCVVQYRTSCRGNMRLWIQE